MARIDPWASTQYEDYARLRDEFGIQEFDFPFLKEIHEKEPDTYPAPQILFRRGVIFGHRDFEKIAWAIKNKLLWCVLTGLMPSGKMHIGNKMVIDQVMYYQSLGADISVAVADIESYATRNKSLEEARELAINEFLVNYIALGLKPEKCQFYFQSRRPQVKDLAWLLAKKVNWSEMRAIYDFQDSTHLAHVQAPLIQFGDILHVQLPEFGGPRPTIVPVGVDQDPHMRLTRGIAAKHRQFSIQTTEDGQFGVFIREIHGKGNSDVKLLLDRAQGAIEGLGLSIKERKDDYLAIILDEEYTLEKSLALSDPLNEIDHELGGYGFHSPSSTYHRFMTGLTGEKMSSSKPETSIYLTDTPDEARKKIMSCKTGGAVTLEEQKKNGGKPDECTVYELFTYHLIESDEELGRIRTECTGGERMCGTCKKDASELMGAFLKDLAEKRDEARGKLDEYLAEDSR